MTTAAQLVLAPLHDRERGHLATEQMVYLVGEHRLAGVPGTWSPRPDGVLGARVELGAAETVTVDGAEVGNRIDLTVGETVRVDDDRRVEVVVDNQYGNLKVVALVLDDNAPLRTAVAGVLAYPEDPRWRRPVRFVAEHDPNATTAFLRSDGGDQLFHRRRVGWFDIDLDDRTHRLEVTDDGARQYVGFSDDTDVEEGIRPAARMIWLTRPANEIDVLDFNNAILNPSSFNPVYSCPLPLESNRLPLAVTAGRRRVLAHAGASVAGV